MKKWRVYGRIWSKTPQYREWDTDHKYPMYDKLAEIEYPIIEANSLLEARIWLLQTHPNSYFGSNICEVEGNTYMMIATPDYYEFTYGTLDREAILKDILHELLSK